MRHDFAGQKFGRLTVVGDSGLRNQRAIMWSCVCDCGKSLNVKTQSLTQGSTRSCGCLQRQLLGDRKFVDHTGKRFGFLTVVSLHARGKFGASAYARWACRCDCGREKVIRSNSLTQGEIISCGCQHGQGPKIRLRPANARALSLTRANKRRALELGSLGSFTNEQVSSLYIKQKGKCANCTDPLGDQFHRDHRKPLSLGGSNSIENIELLCQPCNNRKHAKDQIAWANENGRLL